MFLSLAVRLSFGCRGFRSLGSRFSSQSVWWLL